VCTLLRLSHSYAAPALQTTLLDILQKAYPSTLREWDSRGSPDLLNRQALDLLDLLVECHAHMIMPALLYTTTVRWAKWVSVMEVYDCRANPYITGRILTGVRALPTIFMEIVEKVLYCHSPDVQTCKHSGACKTAIHEFVLPWIRDVQNPRPASRTGSADPLCSWRDIVEGTESGKRLMSSSKVCDSCRAQCQRAWDNTRLSTWNRLPEMFDLWTWETLRAFDRSILILGDT
jgi:hypothetical protein